MCCSAAILFSRNIILYTKIKVINRYKEIFCIMYSFLVIKVRYDFEASRIE